MTARAPKPLPPPTMQERATAAIAARALRAAIAKLQVAYDRGAMPSNPLLLEGPKNG